MKDELLIKRAKKGDPEAFEELVQSYRDKIYAVCLRVTKNREDAFDAAQECLIKIYMNIGDFNMKSEFSTWAYVIARNTSLDIVRKRRPEATGDEREFIIMNAPSNDSPEKEVENNELRKEIIRQVNMLPDDQRRAVILRDIDGYSYAEAAELLGISVGTLKSRLHRAREKLRQSILPYLEGS